MFNDSKRFEALKGAIVRLARLRRHPALADLVALIDHMLLKGIKLEQETIALD